MSLFHHQTVPCPACEAPQDAEFADSVSADRRPDLREAILDDSFQWLSCESCGARTRLAPSLTYLDVARNQWILTLPATDRPFWDPFERGALEIFNDSFGADTPGAVRALGQTIVPRVAFGWSGLREKLLCEKFGIADAELELLKLLLMRTIAASGVTDTTSLRLLGEDEAGALLIGWVDDALETVVEILTVPRDLIDDIRNDGAAWDAVRAEIASGPFVDITKMLVEPELPVPE